MREPATLSESPRQKALALADGAENVMLDEYYVWRRSWERNPTMDALKEGIFAIRALRKVLESE